MSAGFYLRRNHIRHLKELKQRYESKLLHYEPPKYLQRLAEEYPSRYEPKLEETIQMDKARFQEWVSIYQEKINTLRQMPDDEYIRRVQTGEGIF